MPREVMNYPSPADVLLLKMCQGPDKTELKDLSEDPAYQATLTSAEKIELKEIQDAVDGIIKTCREDLKAKIEDKIAEAVRNVGIEVTDKEGLMAALTEDKQRYDEAYKKGYRACEKLLDKAIQLLIKSGSTLPCVDMYDDNFCQNFCDDRFNGPQEECWKEYLSECEHRHS